MTILNNPNAAAAPLHIAILEADRPLAHTAAKYGGYGGVFSALLHAAASPNPLKLSIFDVVSHAPPPSSTQFSALLITGSKADAFSDEPWVLRLVAYIRDVIAAEGNTKILGVCFGHQILARALGAEVRRGEMGWEASVTPVALTPRGRKVFGKDVLDIFQMHRDIVTSLPAGAENLGATETCAIQGMYDAVAKRYISVQGHPEFTEEIVREILDVRRELGIFSEEQYEEMIGRVGKDHDGLLIARAFLKFVAE